jgi:hypothetical protein
MKLEGPYLTQCFSGHVLEVVSGGELEERCAKHAAEGNLDALILNSSECIECIEEARGRDTEMNRMIELLGCPLAGLNGCDDTCPCRSPQKIADSPYGTQLCRLPPE